MQKGEREIDARERGEMREEVALHCRTSLHRVHR